MLTLQKNNAPTAACQQEVGAEGEPQTKSVAHVHYTLDTAKVKTPVKVHGKVIGHIEAGVFTKSVLGSKHQLKQPPAWAIDAEAFTNEIMPNVSEIRVLDKETGVKYCASTETFTQHSFEFNRGFGDQFALPLHYWQVERDDTRQLRFWEGKV